MEIMATTGTLRTRISFTLTLLALWLLLPIGPARAEIGSWSRLALTRGLRYHAVVLDAANERLIAFGGVSTNAISSSNSNDVFVLPLGGTPVWQLLKPIGAPPEARHGAAVIHDPVRNRLLVHGGKSASGVRNDLWQLTLTGVPVWTQLFPAGAAPESRWGHFAAYDPLRDRMLIFGGNTGTVRLNDVWALPLEGAPAWEPITPAGAPPAVRWGVAGAYDPGGDRLVIHGGNNLATVHADTWALSLAGTPAWSNLSPSGTPPSGRWTHTGAYDGTRGRLLVFGGYNGSVNLNDTWALDLSGPPAWQALSASGPAPPERFGSASLYDARRDRLVLYGGTTNQGDVDDIWELSLAGSPTWTTVLGPSTRPGSREDHAAVLDPVGQRMWMFGGFRSGGTFFGDLWSLELAGNPRWTAVTALGTPPGARHNHTATYDPVRHRILVFGGIRSDGTRPNDLWALSLTDPIQWQMLSPGGTPPAGRYRHSAIYDPIRDRIVFYGGSPVGGTLGEVWSLSLSGAGAWSQLSPSGTPPPGRLGHSAVYDPVRDRMLVHGGWNSNFSVQYSDLQALSLAGEPSWSQLAPWPPLENRADHSAIYDPSGDRIMLFGGRVGSFDRNDVCEVQLSSPIPLTAPLFAGHQNPSVRSYHSAVLDPLGQRMLVFGGFSLSVPRDEEVWSLGLVPATLSTPTDRGGTGVRLAAAYPDPSAGAVTIGFTLPTAGHATLRVYDVTGRRVATLADGAYPAGPHMLRWERRADSGATVRPGLYFYEFTVGRTRLAKRLVLIE